MNSLCFPQQPPLSVGAHGAPPAASAAVFSLHRARKSCNKKKRKKKNRNPTGLHKSLYTRGGKGDVEGIEHTGAVRPVWMKSSEIKRAAECEGNEMTALERRGE